MKIRLFNMNPKALNKKHWVCALWNCFSYMLFELERKGLQDLLLPSYRFFWINPCWRLSKCNCGLGQDWAAEKYMSHKKLHPLLCWKFKTETIERRLCGESLCHCWLLWLFPRVGGLWDLSPLELFLLAIISSFPMWCTNPKWRLKLFTAAWEDWDSHHPSKLVGSESPDLLASLVNPSQIAQKSSSRPYVYLKEAGVYIELSELFSSLQFCTLCLKF